MPFPFELFLSDLSRRRGLFGVGVEQVCGSHFPSHEDDGMLALFDCDSLTSVAGCRKTFARPLAIPEACVLGFHQVAL